MACVFLIDRMNTILAEMARGGIAGEPRRHLTWLSRLAAYVCITTLAHDAGDSVAGRLDQHSSEDSLSIRIGPFARARSHIGRERV